MKTRRKSKIVRLLPGFTLIAAIGVSGAGLLDPPRAPAATSGGLCIRDAANFSQATLCSANDVRIVRFDVLGTCSSGGSHNGQTCVANAATDPCIVEGGTCVAVNACMRGEQLSIPIRANISPGAKNRYDLGFYIAQDGGDAQARGGVCYRDYLHPASSTNTDLQLTSGHGPYYNGEMGVTPTDTCGDLGPSQTVVYDLGAIPVTCNDPDGSGILHVGTCLSWDTNNQTTCNSEADTVPRQSSKCGCESIPVGAVAVCGDGIVSALEQCDDGANNGTSVSCCTASCTVKAAGTTCRPAAGDCDVAEVCTGSSGACPVDALAPSTTQCRASGGVCDPAEFCTGSSASCPADAKSTAVCRAAAGDCDVPESCDGTSDDCPPDAVMPPTTQCRTSAGVCDLAEFCTGTGPSCPPDAKSTSVCRPAAGDCDVAERCDGASDDCPLDGFEPSTAECRASAGACDPAEFCTGSSITCPADAKSTGVCRPAAGDCDLAESCNGTSNDCPPDVFTPSTAQCRASAGVCDVAEFCPGTGASCPPDAKSTAVCRPAARDCDAPESCDGASSDCPADLAKPDGTACNDGNACTRSDTCRSGACVGSDPVLCAPSDQCHQAGSCAPATGTCSNPAKPDDTSCDDGDGCTIDDVCKTGTCTGGAPRDCDDHNPCTDDACNAGQCVNTPNTASCDDGNPCTLNDTCSGGGCAGDPKGCSDANVCNGTEICDPASAGGDCLAGSALDCDDHVVCTADTCDPLAGCVHTPVPGCCSTDAECDDGNLCTGSETCDAATGMCHAGIPLDCDDGDVCTADGCDPQTGCTHAAVPGCCNLDADCDDQDLCTADTCVDHVCNHMLHDCSDHDVCTGTESCDATTGSCVPGEPLACDDGVVCTADGCDPQSGCTHTAVAGCCRTDADCDDQNACNGVETCATATGQCQAGAAPTCDDGNACTTDTCDPASGCLHAAISCDDGNLCTRDECDPTLGCLAHPIPDCCNSDADCLDTNVCNGVERCVDHACTAGVAPDCDDHNPCTDDRCDPAAGCMHVINAAPCDDGNACTQQDTCHDGRCQGTPLDCDDHNPCTQDSCVAGSCVHAANDGIACDDGNACTIGDTCSGGRCVSGPAVTCGACKACDPGTGRCTIDVVDGSTCTTDPNGPPDCSRASASPAALWPPKHQFVDVSVVGVSDPDGDAVTVTVTGVTQDEPLDAAGEGHTCPDAKGVGTATASLRAEREGGGDGRVYHISFTADDGRGGLCTGIVTVCVPHDQRAGRACVDEGSLVDSTGPICGGTIGTEAAARGASRSLLPRVRACRGRCSRHPARHRSSSLRRRGRGEGGRHHLTGKKKVKGLIRRKSRS